MAAETDLYEICMDCGSQIEITYGDTVGRPANPDQWYYQEHKCPVCGGKLITVLNANFNQKFDLKNEINYAITKRAALVKRLKEIADHNNEQYNALKEEEPNDN